MTDSELTERLTRRLKAGQVIRYESYGMMRTGTIDRIGKSGIVFLIGGRFVFPQSIRGIERKAQVTE